MSFPVSVPLQPTHGRSITADRTLLRLSATLMIIGLLLTGLEIYFHTLDQNGTPANNHPASFAAYAASGDWTAVHLGIFVGTAVLSAGLLVLFFALNVSEGTPRWVGFFGAISAVVALALYGVASAVDGVALKQAVDAWASTPAAEQAARFASAEAIRWLEWGIKSYWSFTTGLALVLFGMATIQAKVPPLVARHALWLSILVWQAGVAGIHIVTISIAGTDTSGSRQDVAKATVTEKTANVIQWDSLFSFQVRGSAIGRI